MVVDPFSTAIVISLIANGLTMLVGYGVGRIKKIPECRDSIRKTLEADAMLVSTIRDVMTKIAKTPVLASNELRAVMMQLFLESPTAESIVRQIYSDFLSEKTHGKSTGQLQKEFRICLAYYLGVNTQDVKQLSKELLQVISMACRKALSLAINQGILSAHEAKSIARHRILLDELQAIRNNLDFLMTRSGLDLNAIKDFEKKYRRQVSQRYQQITIPHFDRAPIIDIDKIFISPNFIYTARKKGAEPETVSMDEFLTRLYGVVVLGDPGGGKSTLAQKICYELCGNYEKRLLGGRLTTPVLIILREYSFKKKQEGVSIVQFMESEVTSKYQLSQGAPSGAFEYLLNNGHLLVIFDGLDELLDPSHRRVISADIESFCNLFPSVPVLVTSRIVGYEQAPLNPDRFETFRIAPFNDEQVSEYAEKWYANDPTLTANETKWRSQAFLKESLIVSDLRSNPLMLALMCNLYRGAGFIPRNRPEVYKKCSEMLLERWDPSRGIWVHLPLPEPKFLISHLARWIYSNEALQSGARENVLIKESTKFLLQRRFESEEEAEKASKEFLEFCRGRAWVFTDAGTTTEGVSLYKFTHKTFLEYFTAANIVRNNNTPEKLWDLLGPKIAERTWDVVAQLAFQMLHEQVEGASDEILMFLIQDSQKKKSSRWPYLSFGARCLQFIYPSPKTIRALTEAAIGYVIEGTPASSHHTPASLHQKGAWLRLPDGGAEELVRALLFAAPECRPTVADSLQSEIVDYTKNRDDKVVLRAIDLGLMLSFPLHPFGREYPVERGLYEYWSAVEKKISKQVDEKLYNLACHNFLAFRYCFNRHDMPVEKIFAWYTPDHLFLRQGHFVFGHVFRWSIAREILMCLPQFDVPVTRQISEQLIKVNRSASEIGKILLNIPLPCFSCGAAQSLWRGGPILDLLFAPRFESTEGPQVTVSITGDAMIGVWCLFAVIAEVIEKNEELVREMKKSESPFFKAISDVIEARMYGIIHSEALQGLSKFNFPQTALEFVERWITGHISFVQPSGRQKLNKES